LKRCEKEKEGNKNQTVMKKCRIERIIKGKETGKEEIKGRQKRITLQRKK
jgi:hypothetical protein